MVSDFVYIITRIQDGDDLTTPIPNLGVHRCPVTAVEHFNSVVSDRIGLKYNVDLIKNAILEHERYSLIGSFLIKKFGKNNEEIRLEKWRVK